MILSREILEVDRDPLRTLAGRYPQLSLPIAKGMHETDMYRDSVLRGYPTELEPVFSFSKKDSLTSEETPAGTVEILFLENREDFEHAVRALGYRCEPEPVPASMGATIISGLINWEKIRPHMSSTEEFRAFTADKANYLDTLIILSSGGYSGISAYAMNMDESEWLEKSIAIRKYHELSHFVSQRLFPENREVLRDEIVADMIGIIAAFGSYDVYAAELFLGIDGESYRSGGRLQNYAGESSIDEMFSNAKKLIKQLETETKHLYELKIFDILLSVEDKKIGL